MAGFGKRGRKGQVMGKKERIEALEERVTALEAEKPGPVFTETALGDLAEAQDERNRAVSGWLSQQWETGDRWSADLPAPEPSLWWFEDQFWVRDEAKGVAPLTLGDVGFSRSQEQIEKHGGFFVPRRFIHDWTSNGHFQHLRPAKTFPLGTNGVPHVESGEVRPAKAGETVVEDHYAGFDDMPVTYREGSDEPKHILIPISEARKRCGVEEDRHEGDLPGTMEDRVTEALAQRDEEKSHRIQVERDLEFTERQLEHALTRLDLQEAESDLATAETSLAVAMDTLREKRRNTNTLVNLVRDWPDAPVGVMLYDSLREQLREALEPFEVGDGKAVRHEGVE